MTSYNGAEDRRMDNDDNATKGRGLSELGSNLGNSSSSEYRL
jgi:hypothetical protein